MDVSGTIDGILNQKSGDIFSISPEATVFEAIELMDNKNVGALLVMEADRLIGMISERDYTRKVMLRGKRSREQLSVPLGLLVSFHRTANCAMPTEIHPRERSTPNPNRAMSRRPTLRLITSRHLTSIISLARPCTSRSSARYRSCGVCGRGDGEIN